jgi:hypothetical protein
MTFGTSPPTKYDFRAVVRQGAWQPSKTLTAQIPYTSKRARRLLATVAGTEVAQVLVGVDSRLVSVGPVQLEGVVADPPPCPWQAAHGHQPRRYANGYSP